MVGLTKVLLFAAGVTSTIVDPRNTAWVAQMHSDIDTISDSLDRVTNDLNDMKISDVPGDIKTLNQDLQVATKDVVNGASARELEAMAITFYVQEVLEPKVDNMIGALKKAKGAIIRQGKRTAVRKELKGLVDNTRDLGDALLSKTPDDEKDEAKTVMDQIVGKLKKAEKSFR